MSKDDLVGVSFRFRHKIECISLEVLMLSKEVCLDVMEKVEIMED